MLLMGFKDKAPRLAATSEIFIWLAAIFTLMIGLQLAIPAPLDDDTAYHFAVARLMGEHGLLHSFPWTRFSWLSDHYADKEFLFHLLFVPFASLGYDTAARIVGAIGGASVLGVLYLIMRAEQVRFAPCWAVLPLGTTIFLYRFCQVRPHLFSIALAILLLWAYCRQRLWLLFLAGFFYPLFYVAFWQLPLLLVVAAEGGRLLSKGEFKAKPVVLLILAVCLGVVIHPDSYNLLKMNWIHMADILFRNAWGKHVEFNMGEEFEPFTAAGWLSDMLLPSLAILAAFFFILKGKKYTILPAAFSLAMLLLLILTLRTNRFLEYLVPFSFLTLAISAENRSKTWLLPLMVTASIAVSCITGTPLLKYIFSASERPWQMSAAVASEMNSKIPAGANVFTCGWEYAGTLMVNFPGRNFMVALDPTLLYKRDPDLYDLWYRTMKDAPRSSAETVRKSFDSSFALCLDHPTLHPFFNALAADNKVRVLYSDGKWTLFDMKASAGIRQ